MRWILKMDCILILFLPHVALPQEASRPTVAVVDFAGEGVSEFERVGVTRLFVSAVFETGLVEVIDRNQREEILSEIQFSLADCTDEECAIEVGRLLAADIMIVGSLSKLGSRLSLDVKAIDVATSRIIGTHYKTYNNIDEIVDNIYLVSGQLVQNFTGEIIQKRPALGVEDLVVLQVICDLEGASVFVDGNSIGKIIDGQITKTANRLAEINLVLVKDGYYDYEEVVILDQDVKTVSVAMDEKILRRFALDGKFGGGMTGSLHLSVFIIPNWWFVSAGIGFTLVTLDPALCNIPLCIRTGTYLFRDYRKPMRFYVGSKWLWNQYRILDWNKFACDNTDFWGYRLNGSLFSGLEYRILGNLKIACEVDLFVTALVYGEKSWMQLALVMRLM